VLVTDPKELEAVRQAATIAMSDVITPAIT
jgi:hypothetical protein